MKLEGVFLDSRLGRRIFILFAFAATVPVALLSALAYGGWTSYLAAQERERLTQSSRYFGLTVLDRLLVARSALRAADLEANRGSAAGRRLMGIFRSVSLEGENVAGDANRAVVKGANGAAGASKHGGPPAAVHGGRGADSRLYWSPGSGDAAVASVMIRVADPAGGRARVAELDPAYLWSGAVDEIVGVGICVFAADGARLFCSSGDRVHADGPRPADALVASWDLFLRHEFAVDDWRFTAQRAGGVPSAGGFSFVGITWQVVVASLLLVIGLSLVHVRRTTVPLQQLTAGTRRLSAGDYGVRVDVRRGDEIGELGAAFNEMAGRIGQQMHELEVLSSIDREILEASDAARLARRALTRLAELSPGAPVGVALVDPAVPARLACTLDGPSGVPCDRSIALTAPLQNALLDQGSGWRRVADLPALLPLLTAFAWPPDRIYVAPARWHGRTLGVLLVGQGARVDDASWGRQVGELRDRIAVALASAARESELLRRATHDSLTGLLNRSGLQEALEHAVRAGRPFAVMLVDLDRFKVVNDTMGHDVGDELLALVALRIGHCLPLGALLARLGGDEFVALVPDVAGDRIQEVADELILHVGRPVTLRGTQLSSGASLGVAMYPDDAQTPADLLRRADMAMYAAKARGRAQMVRFEPALDNAAMEHAVVSRDLAVAVDRGELRLHYQPRVDACTGVAHSAEALVRWQHPRRGLLMPGAFIALAEESGLVIEIGLWVLREACRQLADWRRENVALARVAVNLSVHQLHSESIFDDISGALRSNGLAPSDLELEITESVAVGDVQGASRLIARLRATGVRIAIDDFGTGYSSMAYLRYLPVDVLKIDRAFVKDIGSDASADIVVRAIVGLAGSLGLGTVAEGVETAAQAQLLTEMGCNELQGYHFARPLTPEALPRLACVGRARTPAARAHIGPREAALPETGAAPGGAPTICC